MQVVNVATWWVIAKYSDFKLTGVFTDSGILSGFETAARAILRSTRHLHYQVSGCRCAVSSNQMVNYLSVS